MSEEKGEGEEEDREKSTEGKKGEREELERGKGEDDSKPGESEESQQAGDQSQSNLLPPEELQLLPPDISTDAVDLFDQQGGSDRMDMDSPLAGDRGLPQGAIDTMTLIMEQWLQQIEGDPAYLMQNQFRLEEQRSIQQGSGPLREPRPW